MLVQQNEYQSYDFAKALKYTRKNRNVLIIFFPLQNTINIVDIHDLTFYRK